MSVRLIVQRMTRWSSCGFYLSARKRNKLQHAYSGNIICQEKSCTKQAAPKRTRCQDHLDRGRLRKAKSRLLAKLKKTGESSSSTLIGIEQKLASTRRTGTARAAWIEIFTDKDYNKAYGIALGCRPQHEFSIHKYVEKKKAGKRKIVLLRCVNPECPVVRKIIRPPGEEAMTTVIEKGEHLVNNLPHEPASREFYRWNAAQEEAMLARWSSYVTAQDLMDTLQEQKIELGCTMDNIRFWIEYQRRKRSADHKVDLTLDRIQVMIDRLDEASDWENFPKNQALLLARPDLCIKRGESVKDQKPLVTAKGEPFSYCIPISSPALLQNYTKGASIECLEIEATTEKHGPTFKPKENKGFFVLDGIHAVAKLDAGKILKMGTVTRNGHFRRIAYAIVSGETAQNLSFFHSSVQDSVRRVFGEESIQLQWPLTDLAPGNLIALRQAWYFRTGACFVHLILKNVPAMIRKHHVSAENAVVIRRDIHRLRLFPPPIFKRVWNAVRDHWNSIGEGEFTEAFETNHVAKNSGWQAGYFGFGLPSHNNSLESDNRHGVRAQITRTMVKKGQVVPQNGPGLIPVINCLFYSLIPEWSKDAKCNSFESTMEITTKTATEASRYALHPYVNHLGNGVYCCRQPFYKGNLWVMTLEEASRASKLYAKEVLTYEEVDLLSSVVFTTSTSCFPCLDWEEKLSCYHEEGVRQLEGKSTSTSDSILPTAKKGRPKKRKTPTFNPNFKKKKKKNIEPIQVSGQKALRMKLLQQERQDREIELALGKTDDPIVQLQIPIYTSDNDEEELPSSGLEKI